MAVAAGGVALTDQIIPGAGVIFPVLFADLLGTGAAWVMEFHGVGVQHIALNATGGRVTLLGTVSANAAEGVDVFVPGDLEGHGLTITGADNVALQIGSVGSDIRISQAAEYRFRGMSVGISSSAGDHGVGWMRGAQKERG